MQSRGLRRSAGSHAGVAGDGGAALLRLRFGTTRDAVEHVRPRAVRTRPEDRLPVVPRIVHEISSQRFRVIHSCDRRDTHTPMHTSTHPRHPPPPASAQPSGSHTDTPRPLSHTPSLGIPSAGHVRRGAWSWSPAAHCHWARRTPTARHALDTHNDDTDPAPLHDPVSVMTPHTLS